MMKKGSAKKIAAREREKERLFFLTQKLIDSKSVRKRKRIKEELARMTFGR